MKDDFAINKLDLRLCDGATTGLVQFLGTNRSYLLLLTILIRQDSISEAPANKTGQVERLRLGEYHENRASDLVSIFTF